MKKNTPIIDRILDLLERASPEQLRIIYQFIRTMLHP